MGYGHIWGMGTNWVGTYGVAGADIGKQLKGDLYAGLPQ